MHVIEKREDAGEAECIEFKVYRSPTDPGLILGQWMHAKMEQNWRRGAVAIASENLGTPVDGEFRRVISYAHQQAIPFVYINDPHGLFPPNRRPAVDCRR